MQAQVVLTIIAIPPVPRGPAILQELTAVGELEGVGTCQPQDSGASQCQLGTVCPQGLPPVVPAPPYLPISYLLLRGHSNSIDKLVLP